MTEYKADALIKKLSRSEILAIALIVIGVFRALLEQWPAIDSFRDFLKVADNLLYILIGSALLAINFRKIRKLRASYIRIGSDSLSFSSRGQEKVFEDLSALGSVDVRLFEILVTEANGDASTIFLKDYVAKGEQQEIKEDFKALSKRLKAGTEAS